VFGNMPIAKELDYFNKIPNDPAYHCILADNRTIMECNYIFNIWGKCIMAKRNTIAGSIVSLVALLAVAAFVIIGFTTGSWHPAWIVFLAVPAAAIIAGIATGRRGIVRSVTGIVSILAMAAFLALGFVWGLWHPGWVVFLAVPVSGIIAGMFTGSDKADGTGEHGPDEKEDDWEHGWHCRRWRRYM
jgi:hypothetical protein